MKRYYIFRNTTLENLFSKLNAVFSGYGDISHIPTDVDAYIWAYLAPVKTEATIYIQEIESYLQQLQLILSRIDSKKNMYVFNLCKMHYIYTENSNFEMNTSIEKYNSSINEISKIYSNVKILDFSDFCRKYPFSYLIDWKFYYLSQMHVNPKLTADFDIWLKKEIDAIDNKRKKCLVLDLDNTLWGGILGEDGIEGIQIGNTYPGNAFLDFQKSLLELSKNGILLTICSKNNETDVLDVWLKNPLMLIKKDQLAAWRINWNNKADNIVELSEELNLGLDSFVFIDDSITERELVKQMLPMVEVPDFPSQAYLLPDFFRKICVEHFQIYQLTDEDRTKTMQYKTNAERLSFQKKFTSFDDYLRSLKIVLEIQELNAMNLSRIAQMTQKTNQFNLTAKRYNDGEIKKLDANGAKIYCIGVSDRFGDSGITGAAIVNLHKNTRHAVIDSFLLSCRVLGKGIENEFLKFVLCQLEEHGIQQVESFYIPTSRNEQVGNFYDKNGFKLSEITKDGTKKYLCTISEIDTNISNIYQINSKI